MFTRPKLLAILILLLFLPECAKAKEDVEKGFVIEKSVWTTRHWCTDDKLEEETEKGVKLEIRKGEILKNFRKIFPRAEVYETVMPVKRQWELLIYYCVSYKGKNDFEGRRKHYYQEGRGRFSKEERNEVLKTPARW